MAVGLGVAVLLVAAGGLAVAVIANGGDQGADLIRESEEELRQRGFDVQPSDETGVVGEAITFPGDDDEASAIRVVELEGSLWVSTATEDGRLRRFDPSTGEEVESVFVSKELQDLAAGHGALWGRDLKRRSVVRVDASTLAVRVIPFHKDIYLRSVGITPDSVWVPGTNRESGITYLYQLAPTGDRRQRQLRLDAEKWITPGTIPYAGRKLWVTEEIRDQVIAVNPNSGGVQTNALDIGALDPRLLGSMGNDLGVLAGEPSGVYEQSEYRLLRVDPRSGRIQAQIKTDSGYPLAWVEAGDLVWVVLRPMEDYDHYEPGQLWALDAETLERVGKPILIDNRPQGIAFADGAVWIVDGLEHSLRRVEPTLEGSNQLPPKTPAEKERLEELEELRDKAE